MSKTEIGDDVKSQIKTKILIIDDHPILRQGLGQLINQESDFSVCAEAKSSDQAMEKLRDSKPDIAIVDLSLDGFDGLELIKTIKARFPSVKTLVLSMYDEGIYAERALRAGAKGYIMKHEASDAVVAALRKIRQGEIHVSEKMASRLLSKVADGKKAAGSSPIDQLTDRELEVFTWLGKGLSTRQIADKLNLSVKTVETYREHIKNKLHLKTANELVRHAVRWVESDLK